MTPFTYAEPDGLDEVLEYLARYGEEAKVIAGGTALVNFMKEDLVQPRFVIGLRRLKFLGLIEHDDETRIGALTTLHSLETSTSIARAVPLLSATSRHVATIRIRMMATIGGAMAYADPSLDTPPALMACDARVQIASHRGSRQVPLGEFFKGIYETALAPDELITQIVIPPQPAGCGSAFIKFLPGTQSDYATVSVAARLSVRDGVVVGARIALGSVGNTAVRAHKAETALQGRVANDESFAAAGELAAEDLEPLPDFRGSADYKRRMAAVHVRRALAAAGQRAVH